MDPATGDVYVAYEFNWATNLFGCPLQAQEHVAYALAVREDLAGANCAA